MIRQTEPLIVFISIMTDFGGDFLWDFAVSNRARDDTPVSICATACRHHFASVLDGEMAPISGQKSTRTAKLCAEYQKECDVVTCDVSKWY